MSAHKLRYKNTFLLLTIFIVGIIIAIIYINATFSVSQNSQTATPQDIEVEVLPS